MSLTGCTGDESPSSSASPKPATRTAHPVFSQKLDRQLFLAVRETQKAGNASFVQKLTFVSKKGDVQQKMSGELDFAGGRGRTTMTWSIPAGTRGSVRRSVLGTTPGRGYGEPVGRYLVDRQDIHYRGGDAGYWLRYTDADSDATPGDGPVDHMRGTESPIGGSLLEGITGSTATAQRAADGGRTYQGEMPLSALWHILPPDLEGLSRETYTSPQRKTLPLTVTVDRNGRVTHARADLTGTIRMDSSFSDFTSVTMDLTLTRYGTSKPTMTPGAPVRLASSSVADIAKIAPGACIDFATGRREGRLVVTVPCSAPHDGRVFAQADLTPGKDDTATNERADVACRRARNLVPQSWISDANEPGTYWRWWTKPESGTDSTLVATCYVITRPDADRRR
ncbi:hypothetical protein ACFV2S_23055 [Streptomyces sp. NPDC059695]|uniref:hypothetical protein n=1 Tax=Streptomyces sp. NPDC059695 TaxID=3346910 RepID=UPI0036A07744